MKCNASSVGVADKMHGYGAAINEVRYVAASSSKKKGWSPLQGLAAEILIMSDAIITQRAP
jgi:hypothetical protein